MRGETVKVMRYTPTRRDRPRRLASHEGRYRVGGQRARLTRRDEQRHRLRFDPDGVTVAFTCLFPRSYAYRSLRGASVRINSHDYEVIGDPRPLDGGMKPTAWNLTVEVTDTEG